MNHAVKKQGDTIFATVKEKLEYDLTVFRVGQVLQGSTCLYENAERIAAVKRICVAVGEIPFTPMEEKALLEIYNLPETIFDLIREEDYVTISVSQVLDIILEAGGVDLNMNRSELIAQAKQTDLVALLGHLGYTVQPIGKLYTVKEYDSVRIYNRRTWVRFSSGKGGSPIDWLKEMENRSFEDAVQYLLDFQGYRIGNLGNYDNKPEPIFHPQNIAADDSGRELQEKKPFQLPPKAENQRRLFGYLCTGRGISYATVKEFFSAGIIYLSDRNNAVFLGRDAKGIAQYAFQRGTGSTKYRGDVPGSNKMHYGFNRYRNDSDTVVVTEAAIDLMSYADLTKDRKSSLLALGMCHDSPLVQYLADHSDIKHIKLLLDSDSAGTEATEQLMEKYRSPVWSEKGYTVEDIRYPKIRMQEIGCKDVNELQQYCNSHPEEMSMVRSYFLSGKVKVPEEEKALIFDKAVQEQKQEQKEPEKEIIQDTFVEPDMNVKVTVPTPEPEMTVEQMRELLLSCLSENYHQMDQVDMLTRQGKADAVQCAEAVGAAYALYTLCEKVGLHPPLPGEETLLKGKDADHLQEQKEQNIPPPRTTICRR